MLPALSIVTLHSLAAVCAGSAALCANCAYLCHSNGEDEKPLLVYIGRLGAEKNLGFLRPVLDQLPGVRLAFVGDGPSRAELEEQFEGTPTVGTCFVGIHFPLPRQLPGDTYSLTMCST